MSFPRNCTSSLSYLTFVSLFSPSLKSYPLPTYLLLPPTCVFSSLNLHIFRPYHPFLVCISSESIYFTLQFLFRFILFFSFYSCFCFLWWDFLLLSSLCVILRPPTPNISFSSITQSSHLPWKQEKGRRFHTPLLPFHVMRKGIGR